MLITSAGPDGKWIAWLYASGGYDQKLDRIGIMSLAGGPPVISIPFSRSILDIESNLQWTPDGRAIVYVQNDHGISNLYLQPIHGDNARQLTHFTADRILYFAWSQDWKQLAVIRATYEQDVILLTDDSPTRLRQRALQTAFHTPACSRSSFCPSCLGLVNVPRS